MPQNPVKTTLFVSRLIAGAGISLSPVSGEGIVTVAAVAATPSVISSATPPTTRQQDTETTLSAASVAVNPSNGSIVAIKGGLTMVGATAGYFYGAEGKVTASGVIDIGSGYLTGAIGQMNLAGATLTSGHVAAVIANIQNPVASALVDGVYVESSGPAEINSILKGIANTNFIFDVSVDSGSPVAYATSSSSVTGAGTEGWLKVNVGGQTRYIALSNAVS